MPDLPLAEYLRPKKLDEVVGQDHLVGPAGVFRKLIEKSALSSMILWGPPGVGKTTLALALAGDSGRELFALNAISGGVKDVREIMSKAASLRAMGFPAPILFIDEIHRFSKSQQDSLLGGVEKGEVILIGATTENPSFEVIAPLLSRCRVYILNQLNEEELLALAVKAIRSGYFKDLIIRIEEKEALLEYCGGDARRLLGLLELIAKTAGSESVIITNALVSETSQRNASRYDKDGEMHYDIISAFIKSIRGSDPNAALYWLARMLHAGEDPLFIARRMLILSSEDVGNANPTGLVLAQSCFAACHQVGMPECRIILAQCAVYLASSPKSNASYMGIETAMEAAQKTHAAQVPMHLRNGATAFMKNIGYGKNYQYSHSFENNFAEQEYLPQGLEGTPFYQPGENAREHEMRQFLQKRWKGKYGYGE